MKVTQRTKALVLISSYLFVTACTKTIVEQTAQSDSLDLLQKLERTQDITLKKGKLIEVVYLSIKKGKEQILKKEYVPKAMALSKEYGGRMLGRFAVIKKVEGDIRPQMLGIFEWPSLAAKESMLKDERYKKIKVTRDAALSFLKSGYYEVEHDKTIRFKENKVYEFFGAWLDKKPAAKEKLKAYFKVSAPIKKRYGRAEPVFKTMLNAYQNVKKGEEIYSPELAGIIEWDKSEDFFILQENEEFKKDARPLMDEAIARIDGLHTKIIFKTSSKPVGHKE